MKVEIKFRKVNKNRVFLMINCGHKKKSCEIKMSSTAWEKIKINQ